MRITDVLRVKGTRVVTINPDMKVRALLDVLAEHGIGAVIVSHDGTSIDGIAAIDPTVAPSGMDAETAQRPGYAPDVIVLLTDGANTQGVEPAKASDAVDGDTPARAATVLSVARSAIALRPGRIYRIDLTG